VRLARADIRHRACGCAAPRTSASIQTSHVVGGCGSRFLRHETAIAVAASTESEARDVELPSSGEIGVECRVHRVQRGFEGDPPLGRFRA